MAPSPSLGKIIGIQIELHWTFLLLLLLIVLSGGLEAFLIIAVLFTSVVFHELAHSYVAKRNGIDVKKITLYPIGGMAVIDELSIKPDVEFKMAIAGPLFNFAVVAVTYPLLLITGDSNFLLSTVFQANLVLGVFNLLPAIPMDGGRVWRSLRERKTDHLTATRDAVRLSHLVVIILLVASLYLGLAYDMLGLFIWNLIIGMFVYFGSDVELNFAVVKAASENLYVRDVMEPVNVTVPQASNLDDAFLLMSSAKATELVALGTPVKILTYANLARVKREDWGKVTVGDAAQQCPDVAPDEKLIEAWKKMRYSNTRVLPVVYRDTVIGSVSEDGIESMILLNKMRMRM